MDSEAVERVRFLQGWVERRRVELIANNGDVMAGEWLDDLEEELAALLSLAKPVGGAE